METAIYTNKSKEPFECVIRMGNGPETNVTFAAKPMETFEAPAAYEAYFAQYECLIVPVVKVESKSEKVK